MQALILAAGMGKRLGHYTKDSTKCMVEVNGKSIVEYALIALSNVGIEKIIFVVGYKNLSLKNHIKSILNRLNLNLNIEYINNPIFEKTNNIYSLYLAKDRLVDDDTILLESDLIFDEKVLFDIINNPCENLAMVSKFESWMDGTCVLLDSHKNIVGVLDKSQFNWADSKYYYKTVNIYKFSKTFSQKYYIPFLEAYQKAFGKNQYYESVLKVLAMLGGSGLKGFEIRGDMWYEIDDPQDLAIAKNRFAPAAEKLRMMENRYGGYWRFPEIYDFCYLVNPFFPPQSTNPPPHNAQDSMYSVKLLDELKNNFSILMRAYPSGASEQNLLVAKIFNILPNHIVVGNGAAELIKSYCSIITGKTAILYPTFNEYPQRFYHSKTVEIPINIDDFTYSANDILNTVDKERVNNVLLINPDNPTGHFLQQDEVLYLLDELKKRNVELIFDESFIDFAEKSIRYTLIKEDIIQKYPNLTIIKSISKSYGVAGLRLGVLVNANSDIIDKVTKNNSIWNINSFAEYFLQIFDKYKALYVESCDKLAKERKRFANNLSKIPHIKVYSSQANYLLLEYSGKLSITELTEKLLENHNLLVKNLVRKYKFEGRKCMRIAVLEPYKNDKLVSALALEVEEVEK